MSREDPRRVATIWGPATSSARRCTLRHAEPRTPLIFALFVGCPLRHVTVEI